MAVLLGCHALRRGYQASIITYNLTIFDPTWFSIDQFTSESDQTESLEICPRANALIGRLQAQMAAKNSAKLRAASQAYIDFLRLGGEIRTHELNSGLLRRYLNRSVPILTGLSSTYLYQCMRETEFVGEPDDVRGVPTGHFVVLSGYDKQQRTVSVADPYLPNPLGQTHYYEVGFDRIIVAILLGVLTYDANLLIIEPRD